MVYTCNYNSILGTILLASDGNTLTGLWLNGQKYSDNILQEEQQRKQVQEQKTLPIFERTMQWLDIYFKGKNPDFTPPLSFIYNASPFRKMVWNILLTIPYGQTMTYGEIADQITKQKAISKMSAQAVGGAVGHNPISIIVPCHRVVGTNGSLTGYGGGIDKKIKLLELEKVEMQKFFIPKKENTL